MSDAVPQQHVPPRLELLAKLELTPRRAELRRLAAAGREMIERLVSTGASLEDLSRAADALEEIAATLARLPQGQSYDGFAESANAGTADVDPERYAFFDHSPFIGLANPLSPPIRFAYEPGRVTGRVVFGAAYEGPPGCVHGGYVAAAFDELLGAAQSLSGTQGMTARLTVNYRSPTPLGEELTMEGILSGQEGRKIFCEGRLFAGDRLCAEAEGLFISFDPEKFRALLAAREERMGR